MSLLKQKVYIKRKAPHGNTRADLIANIVATLAGATFAGSLIINGVLLTALQNQEDSTRFYSEVADRYINKSIELSEGFMYKKKYYKPCVSSIPNPQEPNTLTLCEVKNESR